MEPCTRRIVPGECIIRATSLDDALAEHAPWCRTAPATLLMRTKPLVDRRRPPFAWSLVLPVAAAELALLVATANRYGYHRDELYFRVAARHPAWGYDDQPALTPLLGRLSESVFGEDPRGLRVVSAVAIAIVVVLVALIARELGAGRAGQAVAALATAASGAAMAVGHLVSTTTFDVLVGVDSGARRGPRPSAAGTSASGCSSAWSSALGSGTRSRAVLVGWVACGCLLTAALASRATPGSGPAPRSRFSSGTEPPLAGAPRLAAARACRRDRQRGPDRQPRGALAPAAAADRSASRSPLACRALVAPAPH